MDVRILRYFLTVAREGNITKAADVLHVTQPTLSRQLMDIENELDAKLFVRGSRKMLLTDEGILLRKRAEEIIELVDKTEQEFSHRKNYVAGNVSIGGGETHAMKTIARIACEIRSRYPDVSFDFYSGNAEDVSERLDKGLIDFGIFVGEVDLGKYESMTLPEIDTWGVLMRKESPLASHDALTANSLRDVPLIVSRQALNGNELKDWFGRIYNKLNIVSTYNLIYNATLLVEEGLGCALCLDRLVNTTNTDLIFRLLEPRLEARLQIAWKKYQILPNATQCFLDSVDEYVGRS